MSQPVLVETVAATRIVTLNRPDARNSLTLQSLDQLAAALDDATSDVAIRCLVVTGAGGHFCAGADLRQTVQEIDLYSSALETTMNAFHEVVKRIVSCEKPIIAMMDGAAVGFGADLAFACDLRVASTRAYAQERFVKVGLMPDGGGTFWLPRLVGTARAMQMMLLAEQIDAAQLHRLGVVATVVGSELLRETTLAMAGELEKGPPLAFAAIKRAMRATWGSADDALRRERHEQLKLLRSQDFQEGVAAWIEKRPPRFSGA
ncbi:MAG: enoyl-CoA hydratase-related protein [Polyangiaceae bacterium]|jgi:enoyl-CoA hydratase/carnithine racemase